MFQALRNNTKKIASTLAAGVLLFSQLAVIPIANADNLDNPNDWPYWCKNVNSFDGGVKFEGSGAKPNDNVVNATIDGITATYSPSGDNTVEKESVTITTDGTKEVKLVVVKGGNDANGGNEVYDENKAPFTDLTAPVNPNNNKTFAISHVIACYDREDPETTVEVIKKLLPANDTGKFNLEVEGAAPTTDVGDGGTTGKIVVDDTQDIDIAETPGTNTALTGYATSIECKDEQGNTVDTGNPVGSNSRGLTLEEDKINPGDNIVCVITNTRKTGNITIIKDSQPDAGRDFKFRIQKPSVQWDETFWLDDDGNNSNLLSNTKTYDNLLAGEYIVKELTDNRNWSLNDIACSNGASVVVDLSKRRAIISLGHDDSVTCTFVNQKKGKIKVFKHTDPAGDQTNFDIQASGTGTIFGNSTETIADGQSRTFKVGHGTFSVSETLPAGWTQVSNSCQDLVIDAGNLTRECHITNAKEAKLKIVKDAVPDAPRNFRFASPQLGNFRLDDDNDNTLDNSKQFAGLAAGTYAVTEQQANDWLLTGITCEGTQNYRVKLTDGKLALDLKAGDDVTCTFTNKRGNVIKGFKFNDLNGNGKRDQGEPGLEGWTIEFKSCLFGPNFCTTGSTTTDANGFYRFAGLDIGEYDVCEVQQSGWVQTKPSNNQCYEAYFEVYNLRARADFGNFQLGKVQGVKFNDVNGNGQRDLNEPLLKDWGITLTKDCLLQITLVAQCEPPKTTKTDNSGAYSFENLAPGKYKVCETQQAIWAQTYPTTADGCHEFEITTSGQVVEADFGNKAKPQVLGDQDEKQAPQVLAVTGSSHTAQALLTGLTILGTLAALHFLTIRRKDYAK